MILTEVAVELLSGEPIVESVDDVIVGDVGDGVVISQGFTPLLFAQLQIVASS